tara:strand:+ start:261 stop:485 length:225 start_codon:yes stop_codon:yes gene_type:complete
MKEEKRVIELLKDIKSLINNQKTEDKWFDLTQAKDYSQLSKSTLRRYIKNGQLKATNRVGKTLLKQSDLELFLG